MDFISQKQAIDYYHQEKVRSTIQQIASSVSMNEDKLNLLGTNYGKTGLAIFYSYLAKYLNNNEYLGNAYSIAQEIINSINPLKYKGSPTLLFYREMAEIGTAIHYLDSNRLLELKLDILLEKIDEILYDYMKNNIIKNGNLIAPEGITAGIYFLTRQDTSLADRYFEELVEGLGACVLIDEEDNYYWKWTFHQIVILGLSRGTAMVINFLATLHEKDICKDRIACLLRKTCNFIKSQKRDFHQGYFPYIVGEQARKALILKVDLGICYSLLHAAKALDDVQMEEEALYMLNSCCYKKQKEDSNIVDAGISYGASGITLIYDKIYRATGLLQFKEASEYWYDTILDYKIFDNEFAGFKARYNQKVGRTNISFNEGILGIGLTLMKYQDKDLPHLDPLIGLL